MVAVPGTSEYQTAWPGHCRRLLSDFGPGQEDTLVQQWLIEQLGIRFCPALSQRQKRDHRALSMSPGTTAM